MFQNERVLFETKFTVSLGKNEENCFDEFHNASTKCCLTLKHYKGKVQSLNFIHSLESTRCVVTV